MKKPISPSPNGEIGFFKIKTKIYFLNLINIFKLLNYLIFDSNLHDLLIKKYKSCEDNNIQKLDLILFKFMIFFLYV